MTRPVIKPLHIILLTFVNLMAFFIIDYVFGLFIEPPPVYLNTRNQYSTNYRNYFIEVKDKDGTYYSPDQSVPVDLVYEFEELSKESFKVLAIGDSFTAGQGVKRQDTWIKQLEKLSTSKKTYGLNYGISGLNINQIKNVFDFVVPQKKSNLIIYALVLNDIIPDKNAPLFLDVDEKNQYTKDTGIYYDFMNLRTIVFDRNRNEILNFFYQNFNIPKYFINLYELKNITKKTIRFYQNLNDPKVNGLGLNQTFDLINQMNEKSKLNQTDFMVMIFPLFFQTQKDYPFLSSHQYLKSQLALRNIKVLDLLPFYQGLKDSDLWVHPVDQHPNNEAHYIAASALLNYLKVHTQHLSNK